MPRRRPRRSAPRAPAPAARGPRAYSIHYSLLIILDYAMLTSIVPYYTLFLIVYSMARYSTL